MTDAMTIREAISFLEKQVPDPTQGLPDEVFELVTRLTPMINVDLLIQDSQGRTLLTWRQDQYFHPGWHIPGGIIRLQETAEERIAKVAATELSAKVSHEPQPIAITEFHFPHLAARKHFISLLYRCQLQGAPGICACPSDRPPQAGEYRWFSAPPPDLLEPHWRYAKYL
jgi:ADP-ribose pyrophosphatase YjhB (NUDIX family)